ncbi:MAG: radical SAM protein [Theionarchaea archaeon]|nr:radical SAM protein [Theionarchaea archaeon]
MKTLLIRPGVGVVEKTLKGPWPPELNYLEKLYREPGLLFRGLISMEGFSHSPTLAVGTILKELGEEVEYLDVPYEFGIPIREELNAERNKKIAEYIARGGYDAVGISCTSTLEGLPTRRIAEAAKSVSDDIIVLVGGYQAASDAYNIMEKIPEIDVLVVSDFEPLAEKLYQSFRGEIPLRMIPNILYRENGEIRVSERKYIKVDPDDLPVYDYSLVEKYIKKYTMFIIEASRGCPFECSFCQEKVLRRHYTVKDAAVAVDEIITTAHYIAQFVEPVLIIYCDPLWGANSKWVEDFCSRLIKRKDEINKEFGWLIGARIGQFDDEKLSLLKKAGCVTIGYGVESLSPEMLKMMNKTRDPAEYVNSVFDTVEKMIRAQMHAMLTFILGLPGETFATIEETLASLKNLPLKSEYIHLKLGLPVALRKTLLDTQIHDPEYAETYGITIHDEYDWEKGYLPRFSPLFDPSRELSSSQLTDIFLDLLHGARGFPGSLGKHPGIFKEVESILYKDQISPEELAEWSRIYRRIVTGG